MGNSAVILSGFTFYVFGSCDPQSVSVLMRVDLLRLPIDLRARQYPLLNQEGLNRCDPAFVISQLLLGVRREALDGAAESVAPYDALLSV